MGASSLGKGAGFVVVVVLNDRRDVEVAVNSTTACMDGCGRRLPGLLSVVSAQFAYNEDLNDS